MSSVRDSFRAETSLKQMIRIVWHAHLLYEAYVQSLEPLIDYYLGNAFFLGGANFSQLFSSVRAQRPAE